jgi:four helix bundle protein
VSIPSNIAEGHRKSSKNEFQVFLGHARGSLAEVETQIIIAKNLDYLSENAANNLLSMSEEEGRRLNALLSSVKKQQR